MKVIGTSFASEYTKLHAMCTLWWRVGTCKTDLGIRSVVSFNRRTVRQPRLHVCTSAHSASVPRMVQIILILVTWCLERHPLRLVLNVSAKAEGKARKVGSDSCSLHRRHGLTRIEHHAWRWPTDSRAGASRLTVVLLSRRCCVKTFLSPPLGLRFWTPAWFHILASYVCSLGDVAHVVDLRQSVLEDLLEGEVWLRIEAPIRQNKFSALAAFPPSSSFTSAFRLASGVGVHGRRELRRQEKEFVRNGTLLALRCLHAARNFHELGAR